LDKTKPNFKVIKKVTDVDIENIRGLLIDIDDTLYSYKDSHPKALIACYKELSSLKISNLSFKSFEKIYTEKRTKVKSRLAPQGACRSRLFAFQDLFEEIGIDSAYSLALTFEDIYWKTLIDQIEIKDEFLQFLLDCKKQNIIICAISDMQANFQILKLRKLGLDSIIDFLVTSEEVGVEKPNRDIFIFALQKLNLDPSLIVMIGDNHSKDIEGALKIGIQAYLLNS
jgi:putative hydrolase of the HAD superfamily|tara:strand:- start:47 stop:727 length:681 start_codon:yes stop_codon:yes gene_type:complete